MTTELVLLLAMFAFLIGNAFFHPERGAFATFQRSGPRLGARIERQLATGEDFKLKNGQGWRWEMPAGPIPTGDLRP